MIILMPFFYGKTTHFDKYDLYYCTTIAHFFSNGKGDDSKREDILISTIIQII